MMVGEKGALSIGESKDSISFTENGSFSLYNEDFIDASTPRRGRSISYLELTSPYNETSLLSDTSLQRMRCLSQSINDLKILRERQEERKHKVGADFLNDDFLKEHAQKLRDARNKIKILEAKYQSPHRRSKLDVSSLEKTRKDLEVDSRSQSLIVTGEDRIDGYSESSQEQNESIYNYPYVSTKKTRKPRPITWANENFRSESNSLSSFGSNRQRTIDIIPENFDWNRNCNIGDKGATNQASMTGKQPRFSTSTSESKWRSMPNLVTNENSNIESRTFLHGEAIPVDPNSKKQQTKLTRKTGFYKVNESPEKCSVHSKSTKQKIREFFNRKSVSKSKKNTQKSVSSPEDALALGRAVRCHPSIDTAYTIEVHRPADEQTFGFNLRKGLDENKEGIFVSEIGNKKTEKFLGGLLHVGDEVLEINNTNVRKKSLAFVQELIKDADKIELAILPSSTLKEQQT